MRLAVCEALGVWPNGTRRVKLAGPLSNRARSAASRPTDIAVLFANTRTFDVKAKACAPWFETGLVQSQAVT
jgi:hypothetical protein